MSVITRAIKSSLDASTDALKAAEEALAAAKTANIHAKAAYDAFCVSGHEGHKKKEEKCSNCKQSVCFHGKPLTESLIKNPVGLRIMTHGDSWKEEQKEMIGTVQSVKNHRVTAFSWFSGIQKILLNKSHTYPRVPQSSLSFVPVK